MPPLFPIGYSLTPTFFTPANGGTGQGLGMCFRHQAKTQVIEQNSSQILSEKSVHSNSCPQLWQTYRLSAIVFRFPFSWCLQSRRCLLNHPPALAALPLCQSGDLDGP